MPGKKPKGKFAQHFGPAGATQFRRSYAKAHRARLSQTCRLDATVFPVKQSPA